MRMIGNEIHCIRRTWEGHTIGLNKAKGKMFKSVGWTWNPISGCTHDCKYCWAKSLSDRYGRSFEPQLKEKFFKDKMPNDGSWVFVGSMGDTFCEGVPDEWILKLLGFIKKDKSNNVFLLQTKNPARFHEEDITYDLEEIKDKVILGTTLETTYDTSEWSKAPPPYERAYSLINKKRDGFRTFLSLEPLAEFDLKMMKRWITEINPEAIEIGLENYTSFTTKPSDEKIIELVHWIDSNGFNYVLKENLNWLSKGPQQPEVKQ